MTKWYNQLGSQEGDIDGLYSTAITRYDSTLDDRQSLTRIGDEVAVQQEQIGGMQQHVLELTQEYISDDLKKSLDSPYSTLPDILADLDEAMREAGTPGFLDGNSVSATSAQQDPDNHRPGAGSADSPQVSQMARSDNFIEIVCEVDASIDAEVWTVRSSLLDKAPGQLVTNQVFDWPAAGIDSFKINPLPIAETGDGLGQVANWSLSGGQRGFNTDADGKLYVELEKSPTSVTETGDTYAQTDNWSIAGETFANTDEGRIHVSLVRLPPIPLVTGNGDVVLSGWSFSGPVKGTNTDPDGKLFLDVTESGGTYTISLYSAPQKTTASKVAEGSTASALPQVVSLAEQNASGLSGSVTLESFSKNDTDIVLEIPFHYARLYRDDGLANLTAEGITYSATAVGLSLAEKNSSGLSGSVDLDYGADDQFELDVPLHWVRIYRSDPAGMSDEQKLPFLVMHGASAGAVATGIVLTSVNGSGLSGTVDLSYSADGGGIVLQAGWQAGDKWTWQTNSDEAGTFQNFFRDQFGLTFPFKLDGTETISDALAE